LNWRRTLAINLEWFFAAAIVLAIVALVRDVLVDGYLPDPFLHAKADTFNDWYNSAYWANNPGAYSEWSAIYPPFSFVFLRIFSKAACYSFSVDGARGCDPTGIVVLTLLTLVNFILAGLAFWKVDRSTALPRALAVALGFPVLYAWERGNLIIPCFTAFILAYGNLLRSARLKALCAAIAFNFKPYLILAIAGRLVRRDWIWLEWCGLFFAVIYAASFAIFGAGDPMTLIHDMMAFDHTPGIDLIGFTTTYNGILTIVKLPLPIMEVLGSSPVEAVERGIPLLIYAGAIGILACLAYAACRPLTYSRARVSALTLLLFMSISLAPGGYSVEFALFFIFFEKWRGVGHALALVCAYIWCVPIDFPVVYIFHDTGFSFLSQRVVQYELPITLGQLLRPGLLLFIEYGLVWATAGDIIRDLRAMRTPGAASALPVVS
jgi:hypothetical protein